VVKSPGFHPLLGLELALPPAALLLQPPEPTPPENRYVPATSTQKMATFEKKMELSRETKHSERRSRQTWGFYARIKAIKQPVAAEKKIPHQNLAHDTNCQVQSRFIGDR
jgi:hypothetical protein